MSRFNTTLLLAALVTSASGLTMRGAEVEFKTPDAFTSPTESSTQDAPKFTITPTGRILMDGAVYMGGNGGESDDHLGGGKFVDGLAIPDVRLGAKVSYGKWKAKIDIGFAYAKVNMKDIYMEYDPNKKMLFRLGYFVHQFGLNSATSSSMKPTMEEAVSNTLFNANGRNLGLMFVYDTKPYLGTLSAFVEADAVKTNASTMGKQGWGVQTRQLYRPWAETGKVFSVGLSVNYQSPTYNSDEDLNHTSFTYSANFPSRVSSVTALKAVVPHAKGEVKLSPELLFAWNRFALESQYYYMKIFRKDGFADYKAQGAYVHLRGVLIGGNYAYDHAGGGLATPAPKTLEVVAGYNYTNANDGAAGVKAGILNDANITFNYYINKWMIARLRYSYTDVRDRQLSGMLGSRHVNTIAARLQILF